MEDLKLKVNQSVQLYVRSGTYAGEYLSRVTEITGEGIQVTLPIRKERLIPLAVGLKLEVVFTDQSAQYRFETEILSRQLNNKLATCSLKKPDKIHKIQRRGFVRVPMKISVEYRRLILDKSIEQGTNLGLEYDEAKQPDFKEGLTEDISGGGILLKVEEKIPLGAFVELKLDVENLSFETVVGEVIRVDELPEMEEGVGLGIEFINLSQSKQDEIVQWVLQKQLELHRKGLL